MQLPIIQPVRYKAKDYGRGWTPATWQGRVVVLCTSIVIGGVAYVMTLDPSQYIRGQSRILFVLFFQILICYLTGEKPGWRWGTKSKNASKNTKEKL